MKLVLLCAFFSAGCPAYLASGLLPRSETELRQAMPEDTNVALRCGGQPCTMVPIEREMRTRRSSTVFWVGTAAEFATGMAFSIVGSAQKNADPAGGNPPFLVAGGFLIIFTIADLVARLSLSDDFHPAPAAFWRVRQPVTAAVGDRLIPLGPDFLGSASADPPPAFPLPPAVRGQRQAAPVPGGKLAVLEFKNFSSDIPRDVVQFFADRVRGAGLALGPRVSVMTRENLLVLLESSGKDLASCEGECEVDTGRRIGADAVVSGDVHRIGSAYKVSMRLYETKNGSLLSAQVATGKTLEELDTALDAAAKELLASLR
jgi:TolB-like protein